MNTTDMLLFNTGQLNWDAISTISNIILVTALVFITWRYARQVRKQTILMEKERERKVILEKVHDFFTPTIHSLEQEIRAIQENKFYYGGYLNISYIIGLSKLLPDKIDYGSTLFDILKNSNLKTQLVSHDRLYGKVNELYDKIRNEIVGPEFKKRLRVLIEQFNEKKDISNQLTGDMRDKLEEICAMDIINNGIRDKTSAHYPVFWDQYKDELLRFKDSFQIKNLEGEIKDLLNQLKELDSVLLDKIKEKREKYREEYQFTKYEIDPELKKHEERLGLRT
jgi:hypothetical protein